MNKLFYIFTDFFFFSVGVGVGFLLAKANAKKVSFGLGTALFIAKRLIDFYTRGRERERVRRKSRGILA